MSILSRKRFLGVGRPDCCGLGAEPFLVWKLAGLQEMWNTLLANRLVYPIH
jgi:hypothetical protein